MQRFFVPSEAILGNTVRITGADAHHISFSLRMRRGDPLSVCTPDGVEHTCSLTGFDGDSVTAEIRSSRPCQTEPPYRVRLFQALPKGDRLEIIVQKAVECGVDTVIPFESSRCVAKLGDSVEKKLSRWNRIAAEAAKQCGRGKIPRVLPPLDFDAMLSEAAKAGLPLFCYEDEHASLLGQVLSASDAVEISVVVGAEGGFSPEEAERARAAGLISVGLGPRILRCETASGFVLACLSLSRELGYSFSH